MSQIDLIFEGGGAKGMVFPGALEVLFEEHGHSHARLLGTSAGAITAVSLAAGYAPDEMLESLAEQDEEGDPVFARRAMARAACAIERCDLSPMAARVRRAVGRSHRWDSPWWRRRGWVGWYRICANPGIPSPPPRPVLRDPVFGRRAMARGACAIERYDLARMVAGFRRAVREVTGG